MTERPGVEQIARVLFEAMGWTTRKADAAGTYGLVHPFPPGLVTGDPDNPEWTKLATRLYDAGLRVADSPELELHHAVEMVITGLEADRPALYEPTADTDREWHKYAAGYLRDALRAATPAPPEPDLDVERLARALHVECVMVPAPYRPEGSAHPAHVHTEEARALAAEYERLMREGSAET